MPHYWGADRALHHLALLLAGGHVGEEGLGRLAVVEGAVDGVAGVDVLEDGLHLQAVIGGARDELASRGVSEVHEALWRDGGMGKR